MTIEESNSVCIWLLGITLAILTLLSSLSLLKEKGDRRAEVQQLQEQIDNLATRVKMHDEIMATYEFFNEHWTATMKGETE